MSDTYIRIRCVDLPIVLSMPSETARWDCEPVFAACQLIINGMLESGGPAGQIGAFG